MVRFLDVTDSWNNVGLEIFAGENGAILREFAVMMEALYRLLGIATENCHFTVYDLSLDACGRGNASSQPEVWCLSPSVMLLDDRVERF